MKRIVKLVIVFLVPVIIWLIETPAGLETETWRMFGICLSVLLGLILKPLSEPIISLVIIGVFAFFVEDATVLFSGYANQGVWFLLVVLLVCGAFNKTGLGKRLAYMILSKFGRTSLGLGYIMMFCDLILSPATGSNTSRSAIVFPIFRGVAESLDSHPDKNPRKLGAYLEILEHVVAMSTAVLFLTGMASNAVIASTIKSVAGIELTWMLWFKAALVPGAIVLLISPLVVYKLYPPELKKLENIKPFVQGKLAEMGEVSKQEKQLAVLFILAILGWMIGPRFGIDMYAVAYGFLALELVLGILDWNDLMQEKAAWNMYLWYGLFFSVSSALMTGGFYVWLSGILEANLDLVHVNGMVVLAILLLISFLTKYFFVSNAAYIASIYPVILTIASTTQVNMLILSFMLAFFGGYGALLCNYGNGASIYIYGNGYVSQRDWYVVGTIMLIIILAIYIVIGFPYWKLLGFW
ncbi:DASS family sodium-coupled anion symporter [Enterococcus pallens]|uniref:Divalent anion:Na+ symporter (DASS) family transporter n=1 Tax=Enterococcus pallens ATCC BAA-351 TaxID=1158607 RepID=R2TBB1_9ENTE|nr:DASS family sodium-coupled anion symporter [Enterococcus pallens]EOH97474.1 divalent anion:Na+ symporter (DASS) family transporter [Enterococcus pallens ATCC BAA-351]EOU21107.1 hypothetical protein I588_01954 [Enterococcus pallens ATCC BAA-351]OJG80688.1 divalent anion:Na+ symporter (DASS) family transporter [Enterococcus pallens]